MPLQCIIQIMKPTKKLTDPKLDKKLAGRIAKELEAQYPGGFARNNLLKYIDQAALGAIRRQEEAKDKKKQPAKKPNLQPMDANLVSAMEKRLANLEGLVKAQRAEIKQKAEQLVVAESELGKLRKEVPADRVKKYRQAKLQNDELLKENNEIKAFLKEYGYNWDDKSGEFNLAELKSNLEVKGPAYRNDLPREIDLRVIMQRIDALNAIAEADAKKINSNNGVHSLGVLDPLMICFYKNGIVLDGFPFHPYHAREAQGMLSDILDGYFPYDLKAKYPEGVPLKVVDKTVEKYLPKDPGKPKESEKAGSKEAAGKVESAVKKDSKVGEVMQDGAVVIQTAVTQMEGEGKPLNEEVVNLRIRTENGKLYLLIKLLASDTMKSVYEYARPYR
eukprot:TRINITY_DN9442_c0_g7_i2.p1 TRINITY_DN9442_c0_g7~~TRINITY_DN9442_c0_g7_i2.p1  ORF type:complete len:390 (-),score=118.76 TRINITY_DN9442_c0_g7_i2:104-1273(-)